MPENTENHDLIEAAQDAVAPAPLADGIWLTRHGYQVTDLRKQLEQGKARPDRKTGDHITTDVRSFVAYLAKHGLTETEVWAHDDNSTIRAVINAHLGQTGDGVEDYAGWGDHTANLVLKHTDDWQDWTICDGKLDGQVRFAEFIEDHLPNFVAPAGADMLELAQTFQATTKVDFASSQRIKSGETQLTYNETQAATAGKKGQLVIPDTFTIALQPYERGQTYKVDARFRYRITGGELRLGYRLTRPKDVLRDAFDQVVTQVAKDSGRDIWSTT